MEIDMETCFTFSSFLSPESIGSQTLPPKVAQDSGHLWVHVLASRTRYLIFLDFKFVSVPKSSSGYGTCTLFSCQLLGNLKQIVFPMFYRRLKGEVQWNNNAIWKVRGDNTNEHGIIVFINSSIDMKNISFKVFSYTLCLQISMKRTRIGRRSWRKRIRFASSLA